jgi:hypothetical protein
MVLTVKERLLLLQILPQNEGPAMALRLRQRVALRPEEVEKIRLHQEEGKWKWDPDIASEIEFLPTARQAVYLSDLMENVSTAGKLTPEMLVLFDRLVLPRE